MSRLLRLVACHMPAALVPTVALVRPRTRIAKSVGSLYRLHFHDLGAEGAEIAREVRAGPERGEVKNFDVCERRGGIRCPRGCSPIRRSWRRAL